MTAWPASLLSRQGTPTAWLEIDGHVIDNSYAHIEGKKPSPLIFRLREKDMYVKDEFTDPDTENLFAPQKGMDLQMFTKILR